MLIAIFIRIIIWWKYLFWLDHLKLIPLKFLEESTNSDKAPCIENMIPLRIYVSRPFQPREGYLSSLWNFHEFYMYTYHIREMINGSLFRCYFNYPKYVAVHLPHCRSASVIKSFVLSILSILCILCNIRVFSNLIYILYRRRILYEMYLFN